MLRTSAPTNPNAIVSLGVPGKHVTAQHMAAGIQVAAVRALLWICGHDIRRVGPHSLRAYEVSTPMMQKLRRWRSLTWLPHLHGQISSLASTVAAAMATPVLHQNIGTRAED